MKLLTVTIPSYNSQEYMRHAIESVLVGGEDIEILIVDDGSSDNTLSIAQEYEQKFPTIVRAIHKENGGHGSAVNTGIQNATGLFFKVLDSDDWFDEASLKKILHFIHYIVNESIPLDMIISNYVYEKPSLNKQKTVNYRSAFPVNKFFGWDDVKHFKITQNLLMHSIMYKTSILKESKLELPEHTFYVDNIFAFCPLPYVKKMYYLNVDLYRYYIGREDQSVNEKVMISRIDQQILVTKLMLGYYDVTKIKNPKLRHYMVRYLEIMMTVTSILAIRSETEENLKKKKELWQYLKQQNFTLYMRLRWGFLGQGVNLPGKGGRKVSIACYKISQKFYGFN